MSTPATNGASRRGRAPRLAEVVRTERLTPHMIRVVLGGEGLAGFPAGEFTDHYVKLLFPPAGKPASPSPPSTTRTRCGVIHEVRSTSATRAVRLRGGPVREA